MTTETINRPADVESLRSAWEALLSEQPKLRIRDAATALGVGEAQLLASQCGASVTRLTGDWKALIYRFEALGRVKTITRNDSAVHETTGVYSGVRIGRSLGVALGDGIDMRLYLSHWHSGFAQDTVKNGRRLRSLQFFDKDGTAVHKVYLTDESKGAVYDALVAEYSGTDQSTVEKVDAIDQHYQPLPDSQVDVAAFREAWRELGDVHNFYGMLKRFRVGRLQGLRLGERKLVYPVATEAFCQLLDRACQSHTSIMIFVGSMGVAQIRTGTVTTLKRIGQWYNVLDPNFNLHLIDAHIAHAWVVRKPTVDGNVTSLEIYDNQQRLIAQMFGERERGNAESKEWRALLDTLEPLDA